MERTTDVADRMFGDIENNRRKYQKDIFGRKFVTFKDLFIAMDSEMREVLFNTCQDARPATRALQEMKKEVMEKWRQQRAI